MAAALARSAIQATSGHARTHMSLLPIPLRLATPLRAMSTDREAMGRVGVLAEELAKAAKESPQEVALEKAQALVKLLVAVGGVPPATALTLQDHLALKAVDDKLNGFQSQLTEVMVVQKVSDKYNVLFVGVLFGTIVCIPAYFIKVEADIDSLDERCKKMKKQIKNPAKKHCCKCGEALETAPKVTPASSEQGDPTQMTTEKALETAPKVTPASSEQGDPTQMTTEEGWIAWLVSWVRRT